MSVRSERAARLAAAPRCRHGKLFSGARAGGSQTHLECRRCLDAANDADDFVAAYPHGADLWQIADALGVTVQAVQAAEARGLRKMARRYAQEAPGIDGEGSDAHRGVWR